MKIAYFLDISSGLGGAGDLLLKQAVLMSQLYEVIVVIPCNEKGIMNEEYAKRCISKGLEFHALFYPTSFNFYNVDLINSLNCLQHIKDFALKEKISFFHSVQINIAVEIVSRCLNIPHLMNVYQLKKEEFRLARGDIFPKFHLCDSELYSKLWSDQMKIESHCIRPVAPQNNIIKKNNYNKKYLKILMLGTLCERKNQLAAIKVIEKCLLKSDVILEIAGDDTSDYASECKEYVEQHNLDKNVHFFGFVSDVSELLKENDCLLCTSLDESFPSSIVEAVTYDLTIISTPVAGVPELFINELNAFISTDYSIQSIYDSLMLCIEFYNNQKIKEIHKKAEETWHTHFSPNVIRESINNLYQDIVERKISIKKEINIEALKKEVYETYILLDGLKNDNRENIKKKSYYYSFIKKKIVNGKVYIWGAGNFGRLAYELINIFHMDIEIVAFIDKEKEGDYLGIPIIKPEEIDFENVNYFFISFYKKNTEAIEFLKQNNKIYNKDVWLLP